MNTSAITQAKRHLRKADPVMARLIDIHDPYASGRGKTRRPPYNYWGEAKNSRRVADQAPDITAFFLTSSPC